MNSHQHNETVRMTNGVVSGRARIVASTFVVACLMAFTVSASNITYTHDSAGRLTAVNYAGGKTIAYSYTAGGDLTQRRFSVGTTGDSDGDGMDDAWELQYFSSLLRNGTGDFDSDGMSDLAEFFGGTNPTDANSALVILPDPTVSSGTVTVQWQSVPGKSYRLQYKSSLDDVAWTDVAGDVIASGSTASKIDPTTTNSFARFYRVMLVP